MTGNIWKFSDQLDIEDLEFGRRDFITYKLGVEYYGLSPKVFTKLAYMILTIWFTGWDFYSVLIDSMRIERLFTFCS